MANFLPAKLDCPNCGQSIEIVNQNATIGRREVTVWFRARRSCLCVAPTHNGFWCECQNCDNRWREPVESIGSLRCPDCGSKNVDTAPVCHAPQDCPTPDLCSDSEACSWPRD